MSFGGQIADTSVLGWLPRQHFDIEWPIESRYVGYSVRVKRDQDEDSDNDRRPEIAVLPNGDPVIGDDLGSLYWERQGNRRKHGAFWVGPVPSVILRGGGAEESDAAEGQLVGDGGGAIDAGGTRTRGPGGAGGTSTRGGSGAGGATRTRRSSQIVPLHARETPDERFAPHAPGLPSWASKLPGDWTGLAGAGSFEYAQNETWHPDFLGLVASNRGDPSYGTKVFDTREQDLDTDRWAYLQSLVSVVDMGADGRALALQLGAAGRGGGPGRNLFVDYDLREVAYGAAQRGGPFTTGGPRCTHPLGATRDGFVVHPLHFQTGALWINHIGDGPQLFEDAPYDPEEIQQGQPTRVHLRWDGGQGVWRWQTYNPFSTPPPYVQPPGEHGTERSPNPQPGGTRRPQTGGGAAAAGGSSSSGGHLSVPSEPGAYDPVEAPEDILGEIDDTNAVDPALGEDILGEIEDNEAAAAAALAWYGAYNGETPMVGQGGWKPAYPRSTSYVEVPGLVVKAFATADGQVDLTGSRVTTPEEARLFDTAPQVGVLTGWAAGDGTWAGFQTHAGHSPSGHAMAAGGVALLPPDVTMAAVLDGTATTASPVALGVVPGLAVAAFATIDPATGGPQDGVVVAGTTDGELLGYVYADGELAGDPVNLLEGGGGDSLPAGSANAILAYDDGAEEWIASSTPTVDELTIVGKLTVGGAIDPTALILTAQASAPDVASGQLWTDTDYLPRWKAADSDDINATYFGQPWVLGYNGLAWYEGGSQSNTNTTLTVRKRLTSSQTPSDGVGVRQDFRVPHTTYDADELAVSVRALWPDVSEAAAAYQIWLQGAGSNALMAELHGADEVFRLTGTNGVAIELAGVTSTPSTPTAGSLKLYTKDGTDLYALTDAGTEIDLGAGGGSSPPFADSTAIVEGSADATKLVRLEVDGLTTGTTRVLTVQDADGTIALVADLDDYQPLDADLTDLAALTHTTRHVIVSDGAEWTTRALEAADLPDLSSVYQPLDAVLTDLAGITPAAGQVYYHDGVNLVALAAGDDDDVLTLASGVPTWAAPAGGGGGVTDHGALTGLGDDDHTQYALVDGTRAFSSVVSIEEETASNSVQTALRLVRRNDTAGGIGLGVAADLVLQDDAGNDDVAGRLDVRWSDATSTSEHARARLYLMRAGFLEPALEVGGAGSEFSLSASLAGFAASREQGLSQYVYGGAVTDSLVDVLSLEAGNDATTAAGFGARQVVWAQDDSGGSERIGAQAWAYSDPTEGASSADWTLALQRAGTLTDALRVTAAGAVLLGELGAAADAPAAGWQALFVDAAGVWSRRNAESARRLAFADEITAGATLPFDDDEALLANAADATKLARFDLSGLTTGTTRVYDLPDRDGTVALVGDLGFGDTKQGTGSSLTSTIPANTLAATGDAVHYVGAALGTIGDNASLSVDGETIISTSGGVHLLVSIVRTGASTGRVSASMLIGGSGSSVVPETDLTGVDWTSPINVVLTGDEVYLLSTVGGGGGGGGGSGGGDAEEGTYTPTGTWTTNTTYTGRYVIRQTSVGAVLDVRVMMTFAGAPDAGGLYLNVMPSGWEGDPDRAHTAGTEFYGYGLIVTTGSTPYRGPLWLRGRFGVDAYELGAHYMTATATLAQEVVRTAPLVIASGDFLTIHALNVPVRPV